MHDVYGLPRDAELIESRDIDRIIIA